MEINSKIFVAGHNGLVGSAIVRKLKESGYDNIITKTRQELDLTNQIAVEQFFFKERPDYVFDAAAKVGGIHANDIYSAEFIYENIMIQSNLIHNSYLCGVKKFIFLGSVCIYPKFAEFPVKESSLLTGKLEPTNDSYAIAKISGIKMCEAYNKQFGFNCLSIMPANLYGPNDNFHPTNSHVIPGMFHKFKNAKSGKVTFWGDGSVYREFLYVDDLADACLFLMNDDRIKNAELINVGTNVDISIKDLSETIAKLFSFKGEILWDTTYPNGTLKRPLDITKMTELGWAPKYNLELGLNLTYDWFNLNYNF